MKNLVKVVVALVVVLGAFALAAINIGLPSSGSGLLAQLSGNPTPTPPANTPANTAKPATPAAGGKTIPKTFTLDQDGAEGAVPFDHDTHALQNYSPDGKSPIACVECHHTDQPKSALKLPLKTSEREVVLTMDAWQKSPQKVNECRSCHFVATDIPEGKTMPTADYTERGKTVTKELNNELAYHLNCNTCHDAAAGLRPALKSKPGFATSTDCKACHSK